MKKIIVCALLLCSVATMMQAQGEQYLGIQVGFTQPITRLNMPTSGKENVLNPTIYNGFKIGLAYDATIVAGFGYTIGLNYTFGTNKTDWKSVGSNTYPRTYTSQLYHQLEVPVDWQYKFEIAKNTWLVLYTGPTLQCGLSFTYQTHKQIQPDADITTVYNNRYDVENINALKRINVTWGLGAGLQYEHYFVRGGYDFGVINPYKAAIFNVNEDYHPYTRGRFDQWQLKVGMYLFNW